jgi:hypothetical protein
MLDKGSGTVSVRRPSTGAMGGRGPFLLTRNGACDMCCGSLSAVFLKRKKREGSVHKNGQNRPCSSRGVQNSSCVGCLGGGMTGLGGMPLLSPISAQ